MKCFRLVTLLLSMAATASAQPAIVGRGVGPDTLPLQHAVRGTTVRVDDGGIASITIDPAFRYVGGHRFVLYDVADAEQHAFVETAASGDVRRYYWLQFEHYLPSEANRRYNYGSDTTVAIGGLDWLAQGRRYTGAPDSVGDRGAFYALLAKAGLRQPTGATRVRLVRLMSDDRRSELMIIYAELSGDTTPFRPEELPAIVAHAALGMRVEKR